MNYTINNNVVSVKLDDSFDLEQTFSCGQCFRWEKNSDNGFSAVVGNKFCTVRMNGDIFQIENTTEQEFLNRWADYFDLNRNYNQIRDILCQKCEKLKKTADLTSGIRILSQDPWEALCSFIISQNNNIPQIKGIIERLCRQYGTPCKSSYTFPSAEVLAKCTPDDLAPLRAGFRAKYIIDAAQKIAENKINLQQLRSADMETARKELMQINGVGPKVAECTLLYGLHRLEAFPVDVWMKRALAEEFKGITPELFGEYAGIAQQYIFHYMRS